VCAGYPYVISRMSDPLALTISGCALLVSVATGWLTLFRKGTLRMTRPVVIYFGADGPLIWGMPVPKKIHLRALLYSTGKRGHVVESMFVTLRRGESRQTFNVWVYGDDKLSRGSGLYVGDTGVVVNHHFLLPADGTQFQFLAGEYDVDVFASVVGWASPHKLASVRVSISETMAEQLQAPEMGIYFDWGPDSQSYIPHVKTSRYSERHPESPGAAA